MAQTTRDCPTRCITRSEDPRDAGGARGVGHHISAAVDREAELGHETRALGAGEAHREERKVARDVEVGAGDLADGAGHQLGPRRGDLGNALP